MTADRLRWRDHASKGMVALFTKTNRLVRSYLMDDPIYATIAGMEIVLADSYRCRKPQTRFFYDALFLRFMFSFSLFLIFFLLTLVILLSST
ncbi:hypothetical protein [Dubosiella newyorkensis]|uniref:hypothetical protein n=1 Tax=Dubosiella newyorkensis TaxID=1862672 RepID=UPI003F666D9E